MAGGILSILKKARAPKKYSMGSYKNVSPSSNVKLKKYSPETFKVGSHINLAKGKYKVCAKKALKK